MLVATIAIVVSVPLLILTRFAVPKPGAGRPPLVLRTAELLARLFLGLMFLSGGLSKLMPFPGIMGPVWLEDVLEPHGLGLYARFIAWSEALIGLCLLVPRTAVLGAIMLVPLLLNILMVTLSMRWRGTPWVILVFLELNVFLLVYYYDRWKSIVSRPGN